MAFISWTKRLVITQIRYTSCDKELNLNVPCSLRWFSTSSPPHLDSLKSQKTRERERERETETETERETQREREYCKGSVPFTLNCAAFQRTASSKILLPVYSYSTAFKNVNALYYLIILKHRNVEWWRFSIHLPAKTSRVAIF